MRLLRLIVACAAICISASFARANIVTVGDPFPTHSWAQGWNEAGPTFDAIGMVLNSGTGLEIPALSAFSDGSWSQTSGNASAALSNGNVSNNLNFNTNFLGSPADPLTWDFYAYLGGVLVDSAHVIWDPAGGWAVGGGAPPMSYSDMQAAAAVVPTPKTVWGGLALIGVLGMSKLVRSRRQMA